MTDAPRVVTLPAAHAYVDAVVPVGFRHDARPVDPAAPWAPDPLWDPEAWDAAAAGVDVVHVHFGFDHVGPQTLRRWVEVTRRHGVRLVVTVHDLRNPHQRDPGLLDAQWQVLVPAADVVLTLTPGAAREVLDRFGREAVVVPHPAVFDGPAPVATRPGLVGVHLKSFRTNLADVVPGLTAVAEGVAAAGGRLQVDAHTEVADDPRWEAVRAALAGRPEVTTRVHERFDDVALQAYLTGLSVSVLLHRWGTHSGWVEACHDVGTAVVAPAVGYAVEQWPAVRTYPTDPDRGPHLDALHDAVVAAVQAPPATPADRAVRRRDLDAVRAAHARAYRG